MGSREYSPRFITLTIIRHLLDIGTLGFYHISSVHCLSTVIIAFLTAVLLKLVDLSLTIYRQCFIH